jgi:hypothetical protein
MNSTVQILKFVSIASGLCLAACASGPKKDRCPTEAEEPISVCRAREKCQSENSSVGVGVGFGLGHFGVGVGHSQATNRYERCLDENLTEQKEKSKQTQPNSK